MFVGLSYQQHDLLERLRPVSKQSRHRLDSSCSTRIELHALILASESLMCYLLTLQCDLARSPLWQQLFAEPLYWEP